MTTLAAAPLAALPLADVAADQPVPCETVRKAHQFTARLQTTLEIPEQLGIFAHGLRETMAISGLYYRHPGRGLTLRIAGSGRFTRRFALSADGEYLGEITFRRHRRFEAGDIAQLDFLLGSLIYPLRNALRYHDAVRTATVDTLTGIGNRMAMDDTLAREVARAKRYDTPLSLIAVDADEFKFINDTLGHRGGDQVLQRLAARLQDSIRESDSLFRYGGEEFVILLPGTDAAGAVRVAERIRRGVEEMGNDCVPLRITVSLGVAQLTSDQDEEDLFEAADAALYRAKHNGRNQVCC